MTTRGPVSRGERGIELDGVEPVVMAVGRDRLVAENGSRGWDGKDDISDDGHERSARPIPRSRPVAATRASQEVLRNTTPRFKASLLRSKP